MKYRHFVKAIIAVSFLFISHSCLSEEVSSIKKLLGTWDRYPDSPSDSEWELNWGVAESFAHRSIAFDTVDGYKMRLLVPNSGVYLVKDVTEENHSTCRLDLLSKFEGYETNIVIHFLSSTEIWIEYQETDPMKIIWVNSEVGEDKIYYLRSSPED